MSGGRHGMVVVEKEETCGTICANISQFGRDQKGTMYMSICRLGNTIMLQWIASLKISQSLGFNSGLHHSFFCFITTITVRDKTVQMFCHVGMFPQ